MRRKGGRCRVKFKGGEDEKGRRKVSGKVYGMGGLEGKEGVVG